MVSDSAVSLAGDMAPSAQGRPNRGTFALRAAVRPTSAIQRAMANFIKKAQTLLLIAIVCSSSPQVNARPIDIDLDNDRSAADIPADQKAALSYEDKIENRTLPSLAALSPNDDDVPRARMTVLPEPFGFEAATFRSSEILAKWEELQSRLSSEEETLATCRSDSGNCPAAARRFLEIVEAGRQSQGRARLGLINRAVNLSISPVSDLIQYGVGDFWSTPLATLRAGAGDCEDYAIVKYFALREAGIALDDLRLVIVHYIKNMTLHAVVTVRHDGEWLILDNRHHLLVKDLDARHYYPMFVLDHRVVREPAVTSSPR
jgi:predicted transglutaminase-like cysteine proteinase